MSKGSRWKPILNRDMGMQTKKSTDHIPHIDRSRLEHNITQRRGPSEYNSEMLGVQSESESPGADFEHLTVISEGPRKEG